MTTIPAYPTASAGCAPAAAPPRRRVTDAPTRMFHWLFALSFAGAYLTAEGERWRALHVTLGYTVAGLLAFRVLYGLLGPRQARLGLLVRKLGGLPAWLRTVAQSVGHDPAQPVSWRQGQNLTMALAVAALLILALPLVLSGYGTYQDWGEAFGGGEVLEEMHEFFGNLFLAVVLAHVGLIAGLSLLRRKNQALPMLTGRIEGTGPDLARRNHGLLAAGLLCAVLAFFAWQWQEAPQGLLPAQGSTAAVGGPHGEDDD